MAVLSNSIPAYRTRNHRGKMRALVTLSDAQTGKRADIYLGEPNTPESRQAYARAIAEWEAAGRRLIKTSDTEMPVVLLVDAYWSWAQTYYTGGELGAIRAAWTVWVELFGDEPVAVMGPNRLRTLQHAMIGKGWARKTVNKQMHRICRILKWGAARELVSADIYTRCKVLEPLKRGRSEAPERPPVRPVRDEAVDAIKPYVSEQVWAMIELQRLTGARPGEVLNLKTSDIDRTDEVWRAELKEHKNAYRGQLRTLCFGPKAQVVLAPYLLGRGPDECLFNPAEAEKTRRDELNDNRKTPDGRGNEVGTNRVDAPQRRPRVAYRRDAYTKAIARACLHAFPPPAELARVKVPTGPKRKRWETRKEWQERLGSENWAKLRTWEREHSWHPHQLRHSAATRIRRDFGVEVARAVLGHATLDATEIYAEADAQQIESVFRRVG